MDLYACGRSADLLLDLFSELVGVGDSAEGFEGAAGAADDYASVAEHSAHAGFIDADAFDFGEKNFDAFSADEAGLDEHAFAGEGYLGGVLADASDADQNDGDN